MNKSIRWLGSLVLPLFLLLAIWVPTIANAQVLDAIRGHVHDLKA